MPISTSKAFVLPNHGHTTTPKDGGALGAGVVLGSMIAQGTVTGGSGGNIGSGANGITDLNVRTGASVQIAKLERQSGGYITGLTVGTILAGSDRYFAITDNLISGSEAGTQLTQRFPCVVTSLRLKVSTSSTTLQKDVYLRKNGVSQGSPVVIGAGLTGTFSVAGLSITVAEGDLLNFYTAPNGSGSFDLNTTGVWYKI